MVFLGSTGRLLTTGFSKHADRQYSIWDQDDLTKPLATESIDCSSGILFPFYDHDTNMVYLAGKGDGNIRYYEVVDSAPWIHYLNQFISGNPQRGLGFMPKKGLNVSGCEVFRFYKLHSTGNLCEPISMIVPRKSEQFHSDLYPETAASIPALSSADWIRGINASPKLVSLRPENIVSPTPAKEVKVEKPKIHSMENNKKKFAFLSVETVPDYRPKDAVAQEKNWKGAANHSTRIHDLQKFFEKTNADRKLDNENDVRCILNSYNQI